MWASKSVMLVVARGSQPLACTSRMAHFQSPVSNPSKLTARDEGLWYTVPEETVKNLLMREKYEMLNPHLKNQIETFGSLSLMARRPLLDIVNVLERADLRYPALRFVLHGLPGTGKATTLGQLAQVAIARGWTLLYFPNCQPSFASPHSFELHGLPGTGKATTLGQLAQVAIARGWTLLYFPNCQPSFASPHSFKLHGLPGTGKATTLGQLAQVAIARGWTLLYFPNSWTECVWDTGMRSVRPRKGIAMSTWREGRIDTPIETADWLARFKLHNSHALHTLAEIKTSKEYTWSKRESTPAGSAILNVVEQGISQPARANDCVGVLVKELKKASSEGKHNMMVLAARVNSLYVKSHVKREDDTYAPAGDLSMAQTIRKVLRNDWSGGAVAVTTDPIEMLDRLERPPNTPVSLLPAQGFEDLHPFIPVHIPNYSVAEAESFLDFCLAHNWITVEEVKTTSGRAELCHIAGFNPNKLERLVASL